MGANGIDLVASNKEEDTARRQPTRKHGCKKLTDNSYSIAA